jgi:LmbE family N-acetylglucosaminyl deacetylase
LRIRAGLHPNVEIMITSLVSDDVWRATLGTLPVWQPPAVRAVVVAPHPDDETLGAGGLITTLKRQSVEVTVAAVTDGEGAYADATNLGTIRCSEQEEALQVLGVDRGRTIRLGLPDRFVSAHEAELVDRLLPLSGADCHLVAPWTGDFHPDHEACGRAAKEVARRTGARLSFYFFWTWHRGDPGVLRGLALKRLPLDSTAVRAKWEALGCHRSQLSHTSGEPILPDSLLGPVRWPFEVFAEE